MQTTDTNQVLKWLSEGKEVQVQYHGWTTCSREGILRHILNGSTIAYRLEPKKLRIAGYEVTPPELSPRSGHKYYFMSGRGSGVSLTHYSESNPFDTYLADSGKLFLTEKDARAAERAVICLLRGASQ